MNPEMDITRIHAMLDWFEFSEKSNYAGMQGAANFTPAMLPKLWQGNHCPYRNPLYREAWYRGFYSAACWFLIDRITSLHRMRAIQPDLAAMLEWYTQTHPTSQWKRVPGSPYQMPGEES